VLALAFVVAGCDRAERERAAAKTEQAVERVAQVARETGRAAGIAAADAGLTARVKAALIGDPGVNGVDVNVDASQGRVTLQGQLPDQAQVERAAQVARAVDGVKGVDNRLTAGRR
jgi:osmotically-inducible protein OsmY